jgi:hypothetical protein
MSLVATKYASSVPGTLLLRGTYLADVPVQYTVADREQKKGKEIEFCCSRDVCVCTVVHADFLTPR